MILAGTKITLGNSDTTLIERIEYSDSVRRLSGTSFVTRKPLGSESATITFLSRGRLLSVTADQRLYAVCRGQDVPTWTPAELVNGGDMLVDMQFARPTLASKRMHAAWRELDFAGATLAAVDGKIRGPTGLCYALHVSGGGAIVASGFCVQAES